MVPGKNKSSTFSSRPSPNEDTPLLGAAPLSSPFKTFANVFIAIVGSDVLGLPYAFKRTGWVTSLVLLMAVAFLTYYCMMLLVQTRRRLESVGFVRISSFGDLGYTVCGSAGQLVVDVMICLSQAGFCIGYILYISNSLANIFKSKSPNLGLMPKALYIWGCFPFQLGLNSIPTLTHLAPLNMIFVCCASTDDNVDLIVECGVIPVLVKHLQHLPSESEGENCTKSCDCEMEKECAFALGLLLTTISPVDQIEGGIPPLIELLESTDMKVQRAAAGTLRTLAFKNDKNKIQIIECDALPTLVQLLRSEDATLHCEV